jgi:hypothetical protein
MIHYSAYRQSLLANNLSLTHVHIIMVKCTRTLSVAEGRHVILLVDLKVWFFLFTSYYVQ